MSDDTRITIIGGTSLADAMTSEPRGLGEETSAVDMAVKLQDQLRDKQHVIEDLHRVIADLREEHRAELLALDRRASSLDVKLAVERRERKRDRELYEKVLSLISDAVDVWSHDLRHVLGNGGALRVILVSNAELQADSLRELHEQIGSVTDWQGRAIDPEDWPLSRALQGETVWAFQMCIRGVPLLVDAHPLELSGETQPWAVVIYRRAE